MILVKWLPHLCVLDCFKSLIIMFSFLCNLPYLPQYKFTHRKIKLTSYNYLSAQNITCATYYCLTCGLDQTLLKFAA